MSANEGMRWLPPPERCVICEEPIEGDAAEMAYRRAPGTTDDEWLVMQEKPQGIVHPECGINAGMDIA